MIGGVPHWVPPRWIDLDQTPRRNHTHDPDLAYPDRAYPDHAHSGHAGRHLPVEDRAPT